LRARCSRYVRLYPRTDPTIRCYEPSRGRIERGRVFVTTSPGRPYPALIVLPSPFLRSNYGQCRRIRGFIVPARYQSVASLRPEGWRRIIHRPEPAEPSRRTLGEPDDTNLRHSVGRAELDRCFENARAAPMRSYPKTSS